MLSKKHAAMTSQPMRIAAWVTMKNAASVPATTPSNAETVILVDAGAPSRYVTVLDIGCITPR